MRIVSYILLVASLSLIALQSLGQAINIYSNPAWVSDTLIGIPDDHQAGFVFRPNVHPKRFDREFIAPAPEDSNSYSRIRYAIASNQNQRFRAGIHRPVRARSGFDLDILRISNPGWMSSSFYRHTVLNLHVYHTAPNDQWSVQVDGKLDIDDREQNGGLRGTNYSIKDDGGDLGQLNADVYLNDAYTRRQQSYLQGLVTYRLSSRLHINANAGFQSDRFDMSDDIPTESFYAQYREDTSISVVRDSSGLLKGNLAAELSLALDSAEQRKVFAGVEQTIMDYRSNGFALTTQNTAVYGGFRTDTKHRQVGLNGRLFLVGYNGGDYKVHWNLNQYFVHPSDSNGRMLMFSAEAIVQNKRPSILFEQYRSTVNGVDTSLAKLRTIDLHAELMLGNSTANATIRSFYQLRGNYVYFDDQFEVRQLDDALSLAGATVRGRLDKQGYLLDGGVTYQGHLGQALYSVPNWNADATAAIRFPIFNKSIYLDAGVTAWFFSSYRARGYIPYLDQFYIQTTQRFGDYLQFDPFAKATIQSVDVTFKLLHAAYGLLNDDPIIAPGYPSIPRFFQVTIDWKFKN